MFFDVVSPQHHVRMKTKCWKNETNCCRLRTSLSNNVPRHESWPMLTVLVGNWPRGGGVMVVVHFHD